MWLYMYTRNTTHPLILNYILQNIGMTFKMIYILKGCLLRSQGFYYQILSGELIKNCSIHGYRSYMQHTFLTLCTILPSIYLPWCWSNSDHKISFANTVRGVNSKTAAFRVAFLLCDLSFQPRVQSTKYYQCQKGFELRWLQGFYFQLIKYTNAAPIVMSLVCGMPSQPRIQFYPVLSTYLKRCWS